MHKIKKIYILDSSIYILIGKLWGVSMTIVVVSDVHLGATGTDEKVFIDFLKSLDDKVDHLVLLGDIIDMWRRDFTKVMMECTKSLELLRQLSKIMKVHYVVGNHDYYMLRLSELQENRFPFEVTKTTVIKSNLIEFFFMHGYQLEVLCNPYYKSMKTYEIFSENLCLAGDDTGNAADCLWKSYQSCISVLNNFKRIPGNISDALKSMMEVPETRLKNNQGHFIIEPIDELAASPVKQLLFCIQPEQFLIYGHTHREYVDEKNRVANSGCWGVDNDRKYSYLEIKDDKVFPKKFT